jgi:signal transduction histidine kinase
MRSSALVARHAGALVAVAVAAAVRLALDPYLGERGVFPAFLLAVAVSAWWWGTGPATLALLLGGVAAEVLFLGQPRAGSLAVSGILVEAGLYLAVGAILIALTRRLVATQERSELERRRAEAARIEAERASLEKDRFLAGISHELKTPLTAIVGWIRLLQEVGMEPQAAERALATVSRNATSLVRLVDDLLDLSGLAVGKLRLDVGKADVATIVAGVCESALPQAQAKGVDLVCDVASEPVHVTGDAARLSQAVANLVANAIRFTPPGGEVRIRAFAPDGRAVVEVSDTGEGIEPELLPHVWQRFRQSERQRGHGGLGLGLAIARGIVELHGGMVHAASAGKGRGATFRISIPNEGARERRLASVEARF